MSNRPSSLTMKAGKQTLALRDGIRSKDVAKVAAAIDAGADVRVGWENGYIKGETPLMLASDSGCIEVVELLLQHRVDVGLITESSTGGAGGLTALHYALNPGKKEAGYFSILKLLVKANAPLDVSNNRGESPLWLACRAGWKEAVEVLLCAGAKSHTSAGSKAPPLHAATLSGNKEVVGLLLANGAGVDCKNEKADTALMLALLKGNEDMVGFLLNHKADPKAVNELGQTCLMCAALFARDAEDEDHKKAIRLIRTILDCGVAANAKAKDGKTAYDIAKDGYEPDAAKFLKSKITKAK